MNPYREVGSESSSGLTVSPRCEACKKETSIEVPHEWFEICFHTKLNSYMKETMGWVRRYFAPNVDIWFCSHKCAYESWRADEIASYWTNVE